MAWFTIDWFSSHHTVRCTHKSDYVINFIIVACRISSRLKWYKNYKNRLRLAKVIVTNKIVTFFYGSLCIFWMTTSSVPQMCNRKLENIIKKSSDYYGYIYIYNCKKRHWQWWADQLKTFCTRTSSAGWPERAPPIQSIQRHIANFAYKEAVCMYSKHSEHLQKQRNADESWWCTVLAERWKCSGT